MLRRVVKPSGPASSQAFVHHSMRLAAPASRSPMETVPLKEADALVAHAAPNETEGFLEAFARTRNRRVQLASFGSLEIRSSTWRPTSLRISWSCASVFPVAPGIDQSSFFRTAPAGQRSMQWNVTTRHA